MKRLIVLSIVVASFSFSVNAQLFQYGIKAGVNFSSLAMDDILGVQDGADVYNLLAGESVRGYQAGIMTRINVAMFFVQPELYFNVTGGAVEKVMAGGASELLTVEFKRIDIPLLVGAKLGPARINIGPVGSAVISSVNELAEVASTDLETVSSGLTWGFQAGVGIDLFKKLSVDARYEGSLSKYAGATFDVGGTTQNLDARPRQMILAVGWWF